MAKASVECKCSVCGNEFTKTKDCRNRREADNWGEWAVGRYTLCPSCYGKQIREEESKKGLYFDVRIEPIRTAHNDKDIAIIFGGDTKSHKDKLKEIGCIWTDEFPSDNIVGNLLTAITHMEYKWVLWCDMNTLEEKVELAHSIGATGNAVPTSVDMAIYKDVYKKRQEKNAEMQKELETIGEEPEYSSSIKELWNSGEKWNGTIYGRKGHFKVYFSGREVSITDEQAESMKATQEARKVWKQKKEEIEFKYR